MRILLLALALVLCGQYSHAQETPPSLEERMPQADFHAAGLDRLSPEELAHLNQWLSLHTPQTGSGGDFGLFSDGGKFYPDSEARGTIDSRITGTFTGWLGETVFRLDNGQRWRQSESGRFNAGNLNNPAVSIKPMMMGSWLMTVEGCGCSLRVRRIE